LWQDAPIKSFKKDGNLHIFVFFQLKCQLCTTKLGSKKNLSPLLGTCPQTNSYLKIFFACSQYIYKKINRCQGYSYSK
jgi:hypothetical protein